jgi:hypothetical protein
MRPFTQGFKANPGLELANAFSVLNRSLLTPFIKCGAAKDYQSMSYKNILILLAVFLSAISLTLVASAGQAQASCLPLASWSDKQHSKLCSRPNAESVMKFEAVKGERGYDKETSVRFGDGFDLLSCSN